MAEGTQASAPSSTEPKFTTEEAMQVLQDKIEEFQAEVMKAYSQRRFTYCVTRWLGAGGYGEVALASNLDTDELVAIKRIDPQKFMVMELALRHLYVNHLRCDGCSGDK